MILRQEPPSAAPTGKPQPASDLFIELQKKIGPPCIIVTQTDHCKFAGRLASSLRPEIFGDFPLEVIGAISEHDYGWQQSDQEQLDALPGKEPRPFPKLSTQETLSSWNESVAYAERSGHLQHFLVSRHFTLLGRTNPERVEFIERERHRQDQLEKQLPYPTGDLQRWTDAMGFCDLLSLYLCSGLRDAVEFPLAHPDDPAAPNAPHVTLSWKDGQWVFSQPVMKSAAVVSFEGRQYDGKSRDLPPVSIDCRF